MTTDSNDMVSKVAIEDSAEVIPPSVRFVVVRCVEDETVFELTATQLVMHGGIRYPTVGMNPETILAEALRLGRRPTSTVSYTHNISIENIVYQLRGMVLALSSRPEPGRESPLGICFDHRRFAIGSADGCAWLFVRQREDGVCGTSEAYDESDPLPTRPAPKVTDEEVEPDYSLEDCSCHISPPCRRCMSRPDNEFDEE